MLPLNIHILLQRKAIIFTALTVVLLIILTTAKDNSTYGQTDQGFYQETEFTGMAYGNGVIYAVGDTHDALYTIDLAASTYTYVGELRRSDRTPPTPETRPRGLAYVSGTLYLIGEGYRYLLTVDPNTGETSVAGAQLQVQDSSPAGLTFCNNTLYMVGAGADRLYTLNTTTGLASLVTEIPAAFNVEERDVTAVLCDANDTLLITGDDTRRIIKIDHTDGSYEDFDSSGAGFGVSEDEPRALFKIGNTHYMYGTDRNKLYEIQRAGGLVSAEYELGLSTAVRSITTDASDEQIVVSWLASPYALSLDNNPVTHYEYSYSGGQGSWISTGGNGTSVTLTGLDRGERYTIWVRAIYDSSIAGNVHGAGSIAKSDSVDVEAELPDQVPPGTATAGANSVWLSWQWGNAQSDGGSPILYYEYSSTFSPGNWFSTNSTETNYLVPGFPNGNSYTFWVRAVTEAGAGPASEPFEALLVIDPPGQVGSFSATKSGNTINMTWTKPSDVGTGGITNYEYTLGIAPEGWVSTNVSTTNNTLSYTIFGLTPNTTYRVRVRAVNRDGPGPPSNAETLTLTGSVPGAPTALSANAGTHDIDLSWTAPTETGGLPILYYEYSSSLSTGVWFSTGGNTTNYKVPGYLVGKKQDYIFWVRAVNDIGAGPSSEAASTDVNIVYPGPVRSLVAQFLTDRIHLDWEEPQETGSSDIISYAYSTSVAPGTWIRTNSTDTEYDVFGLPTGQTHTFWVRAINNEGDGAVAMPKTATLPAEGFPSAPLNFDASSEGNTIVLTWDDPSTNGGNAIIDYEYSSSDIPGVWISIGSTKKEYRVPGFTRGQTYLFWVRAVNSAGKGVASESDAVQIATGGLPGEVRSLDGDAGVQSVSLTWLEPRDNGGNVILHYEYSSTLAPGEWISTNSIDLTYKITGLRNGLEYTFWVRAVNSNGAGPISEPYTVLINGQLPGKVESLDAIAGPNQVLLTWSKPSEGSNPILWYEYSISASPDIWNSTGGNNRSYTVTGLNDGESYTFWVRAVTSVGPGIASEPEQITIQGDFPAAVRSLTATRGDRKITLEWLAPLSDPNIPTSSIDKSITRYEYTHDGNPGVWYSTGNNKTTVIVSALNSGQTYTFWVRAINRVGVGETSDSITETTNGDVPDTVTNLDADPGAKQVSLSWDEPSNKGGSPILFYEYTTDIAAGVWNSTGGDATNYTITGLQDGQTYTFWVRAINSVGRSPVSASITVTIQGGYPDAPTNFQAEGGIRQAILTWDKPNDGDSPIIRYEYSISTSPGVWLPASGTDETHTITGLVDGVTYTFWVRAVNSVGVGPPSLADNATLEGKIPGQVRNLTVSPGEKQAALRWKEPNSNGGSPITHYQYQHSLSNGVWEGTGSANERYTVTGLTDGVTYTFWVRAVNIVGAGETSEPYTITLQGNFPGQVKSLVNTPGKNEVLLEWVEPTSVGNNPILEYEYSSNVVPDVWRGTGNTDEEITITGLEAGETYTYWVRARNIIGVGLASEPTTFTIPGTVPSAPLKLDAVPAEQSVILTWEPPDDDGGVDVITNYEYSSNLATDFWVGIGSNTTTHTITGLNSGETYTFWVRAVNSIGPGPSSEPKDVMILGSVPSEVRQLEAEPGNGEVLLKWIAPEDDGGSAIITYEYSTSENFDVWRETTGTQTEYLISGLTNGTAYTFWIRAVNSVGVGLIADGVSATPAGETPGPVRNLEAISGNESIELTWEPPDSDGGNPITRYEWGIDDPDTVGFNWTWNSVKGAENRFSVTGLENTQTYYFSVRAVNVKGAGVIAEAVLGTPRRSPPGKVLNVVTSAGDRSVTLSWSKPENEGSSEIISYEYSIDGLIWYEIATIPTDYQDVAGVATSYTVTGLTNGTEYRFYVRAKNLSDVGVASDFVLATPNFLVLEPITNLRATESNRQIRLEWGLPPTYITNVIIRYEYKVGNGPWINTNSLAMFYVIDNLINEVEYLIAVRAVTEAGASPSVTVTATPQTTAPGQVTGLTGTPGDGRVILQWYRPTVTGSNTISNYEYSGDNGNSWITTGNAVTSYTVHGLVNGTEYTFIVRASNRRGKGLSSQSVSVTPRGVPKAVNSLTAKAKDGSATISWQTPSNNGGANILKYVCSRTGETLDVEPDGELSCEFTSLTNDTEYMITVYAVNSIGDGEEATVSVTPSLEAESGDREPILAAPISDHENLFIRTFCGRVPGCPASVLFLGPIVSMVAVLGMGGRNPAIILGIGSMVLIIFMVMLGPNIFTFVFIGLAGLMTLMLWKFFR